MKLKCTNPKCKMNEGSFILILVIAFLSFTLIVGFIYLKTDYFCDVGKIEVAGDYKTEPNTIFNNRQCAIRDCIVFNNYQKLNGGNETCIV